MIPAIGSVSSVFNVLWLAVGASAVAAVGTAISRGSGFLLEHEAHIKNAELRDALEFATNEAAGAAETVVTALNQTVTSVAKANGTWNAKAAQAVAKQALAQVKVQVSAASKATLARTYGDLDEYLQSVIESAVGTAVNKVDVAPAPSAPVPAAPAAPTAAAS